MSQANKQDKFIAFREKYQTFSFESFKVKRFQREIRVTFYFSLDNVHHFSPQMRFRLNEASLLHPLSHDQLSLLLFQVGMVELISYWKAACPKKVVIKPYALTPGQIQFWKKLYYHGLGEFFYLNGIHTGLDDFMEINASTGKVPDPLKYFTTNHYLVPVGGGKDSVVTLQLIKNICGEQCDVIPLVMNPGNAALDCISQAGFKKKNMFVIDRILDSRLLELNDKGYLNGHTPFSALLAFSSLVVSALTRHRYIALSNESSANEPSVPGTKINHQYSKSLEFENDFRAYVNTYISDQFDYFSFLRPLTEFQIAKIFSLHSKYFSVFKSCNVGSKTGIWCKKCPKCLFTFIILAPFIPYNTLVDIFGGDLLDDPEQTENYKKLTGQTSVKPFECVGTIKEVNGALTHTLKNWGQKVDMPLILKDFLQTRDYLKYEATAEAGWVLSSFDQNNIPEKLCVKLRKYLLKVYCYHGEDK